MEGVGGQAGKEGKKSNKIKRTLKIVGSFQN